MEKPSRRLLLLAAAAIVAGASSVRAADPAPLQDKTLVAWVKLRDLASCGGSVLTVGQGQTFDAIVLGEQHERQWMAGSDNYHRTGPASNVEETSTGQTIQMALVHRGRQAGLFRNGRQISAWTTAGPVPAYDASAYVLFGWRHLDAGGLDCYFKGSVEEARIYARALSAEDLAGLQPHDTRGEPPWAWWDFRDNPQEKTGRFPQTHLVNKAHVSGGALHLDGPVDYLLGTGERGAVERVHFRPATGTFADPIPFYWRGEYHVFYLQGGVGRVPWRHVVSRDLVHWRQLPTALSSDGALDSWDGGNMFTGSVVAHGGKFHCFYTGWNGGNPQGREGIRLATSDDLITWQKQPDFLLAGDGLIYSRTHESDFRDAFVYQDETDARWHMLLCATRADGQGVAGSYVSEDLRRWQPEPPVGEHQECPDFFRLGNTAYLLGGGFYSSREDGAAGFTRPTQSLIDAPAVYAGKTLFDGRRHVWVGWLADRAGGKDDGALVWGGYMCAPRELLAGPRGELYCRPVEEVVRAFHQETMSFADVRQDFSSDQWSLTDTGATNRQAPAGAFSAVPEEGLIELDCTLGPDALVTFVFHQQQGNVEQAYAFTLDPATATVTTHGQGVDWPRLGCVIDTGRPIKIQAILGPGTVEVCVDGKYCFSRRTHELSGGKMGVVIDRGQVRVESFSFKKL